MSLTFVNRRKHMRILVNSEISYSILKINENRKLRDEWINGELYDISHKGLSLRVKHCMVAGEAIKIQLMVEKKIYTYEAEIMNVNGQRVGVKYTIQNDEHNSIIDTFINNELNNRQKLGSTQIRAGLRPHSIFKRPVRRYGTLAAI